ncbi:hypothetical protein GH714_012524 [Hevea brasiliensis]|nr:hypothetical protein GH714_012524 [Hevea brasiliensis]
MNVSGSFGRLFGSVKELEPTYFQSQTVKESLLKPEVASASLAYPLLQNFVSPKQLKYETSTSSCFGSKRAEAGKEVIGFVKEGETKFIVMDDLRVFPLSSIFLVDLLNKFNVNDISFWEVKINLEECLELVKASMKSDAVLTDVFIGNKSPRKETKIITI